MGICMAKMHLYSFSNAKFTGSVSDQVKRQVMPFFVLIRYFSSSSCSTGNPEIL